MKDYYIETEVWLPYPREEVFGFFKEAQNLQRITPPWLDFQILTPPPIEMAAGTLIDYRLKLYHIPMRWRTEITVWEPSHRFVDSQLEGPYQKWVHTHRFEERNGGTWMHDRVDYRLPGGILAPLAHRLMVRKNVEQIFAYRAQQISRIFPAPRQKAVKSG